MKRIVLLFLVLVLLPVAAFADLEVHFLDVGQGDCTIVRCNGETMVIDGGPRSAASKVYGYIRETLAIAHVKYVVSTHPHVDHAGGLASVLNAAPADLLLTPVLEWDSQAFRNMMKYAEAQGTPAVVPAEGDTFPLGGAVVTVLHCWPEAVGLGRTNDSSIVVRIDYGKNSVIVAGDAEDWSEYMMLDAGVNLDADVLRVSHHGSRTGTTAEFLRAVKPEYAVISAGKGNEYGHPHREVLERLEASGAKVLRTDRMGTIVMRGDGETVSICQVASREKVW